MDTNIGVINEEWIRKKLNINHENFEDIKVICLPGTYQEKVTKLGNSLHKFTRLKELDLSRNALISLEGIEHLKYIEKLNLYYNNISSMKELERLRHNTTLSELDLRLNPITKQENDYRLFLIYLLPSLKVLDDRAVRDSERQMALSLFEPLANNMLTSASMYEMNGLVSNPIASRVKSVTNIAMRSAGITDLNDDNAVFLNQQRLYENATNNSPSNEDFIKKPQAEEYSPNELKEIAGIDLQNYNSYNQNRLQNGSDSAKELNRAKSNSMSNLKMNGFDANRDNCAQKVNKSVHFNEYPAYHGQNPTDSDFADEREAYNNFKSRGNFTPNPYYEQDERDFNGKNRPDKEPLDEIESELNDPNRKGDPLFILLDLVDRYWNGSKSLHKNIKFLGAANQLILNCCKAMNGGNNINQAESSHSLHQQIKSLQEENRRLNEQQQQQLKQKSISLNQSSSENQQQFKSLIGELDSLKKKLLTCQEENKTLRKELNEKVDKYSNLDSIENQNNTMRRDIEIMRIKLKQFEQLQQLTSMLQESHKSLVTTNEHLLQEVNNHKQFLKATCNSNGSLNGNGPISNGHQMVGHFHPHNQRQFADNMVYSPPQMPSSGVHEFQLVANMPSKHLMGPASSASSSIRKQFEQFK